MEKVNTREGEGDVGEGNGESDASEEEVQLSDSMKLLAETKSFLDDLDVAREMYRTVDPILTKQNKEHRERVETLINEIEESVESIDASEEDENDEPKRLVNKSQALVKAVSRLNKAVNMFRQNSLVLLISKLDEFATSIIRISLQERPEKIKDKDKSINYERIFKYESINGLISDLIEDEVNSIMDESHKNIVLFMDEKFKLGIRDNFSHWVGFIEMTQRRHLFAHTGGVVTDRYINICKREGVDVGDVSEGDRLTVNEEYFEKAFNILYELGLRIGQAIHRRLFPDKLDEAEYSITRIGFDLMMEERWDLALKVFDFATSIPTNLFSSESDKLRHIINLSLCQKKVDGEKECEKVLNDIDWSSKRSKFRLAANVLRENYDQASTIMEDVSENDVSKYAYKNWPLFDEFRKSEEFRSCYEGKFGVNFQEDYEKEDVSIENTNSD